MTSWEISDWRVLLFKAYKSNGAFAPLLLFFLNIYYRNALICKINKKEKNGKIERVSQKLK